MKNSKTEISGESKKCSEKASFNITNDGTVFSMVSKLENKKNNLFAKNIFKINKIFENSDSVRISDKDKSIKIFIKNENNITNYNCLNDIAEPIIMNRKNCFNQKTNTSQYSTDKRNSYPRMAPASQPCSVFLRKKFDSEVRDLSSFLTDRENEPILPRRRVTKKREEFLPIDSLVEKSTIMSDDTKFKHLNYFSNQYSRRDDNIDNKLNDKASKNLFDTDHVLNKAKFVPRYNKLVQTDLKLSKKYSLERKDTVKNVNHSIFPRINEKNQESSNFSLFKSMNSNELGNYIDNLIQNFRIKAHICEPEVENKDFNNTIFYPESKEDIFVSKEEKSESIVDISKICKNDNTSFDKSSFHTQSLTNLLESRAFEDEKDDDLNEESTTFINYTHSFEIDEVSLDDQITNASTTD